MNTDFLVVTAELAVAVAGFSGIVVALESRDVRDWHPLRRRDLRILLQLSALVLLFSLTPLILYPVAGGPLFWKWAVGIYGVVHMVDVSTFVFRQPPGARIGPAYPGLAVAFLQVVVAVFASASVAETAYLATLLWQLAGAAMGFGFLVWGRSPSQST